MEMNEDLSKYLEKSEYVDYDNEAVRKQADLLLAASDTELDLVRNTYYSIRIQPSEAYPWRYPRYRLLYSRIKYRLSFISW